MVDDKEVKKQETATKQESHKDEELSEADLRSAAGGVAGSKL